MLLYTDMGPWTLALAHLQASASVLPHSPEALSPDFQPGTKLGAIQTTPAPPDKSSSLAPFSSGLPPITSPPQTDMDASTSRPLLRPLSPLFPEDSTDAHAIPDVSSALSTSPSARRTIVSDPEVMDDHMDEEIDKEDLANVNSGFEPVPDEPGGDGFREEVVDRDEGDEEDEDEEEEDESDGGAESEDLDDASVVSIIMPKVMRADRQGADGVIDGLPDEQRPLVNALTIASAAIEPTELGATAAPAGHGPAPVEDEAVTILQPKKKARRRRAASEDEDMPPPPPPMKTIRLERPLSTTSETLMWNILDEARDKGMVAAWVSKEDEAGEENPEGVNGDAMEIDGGPGEGGDAPQDGVGMDEDAQLRALAKRYEEKYDAKPQKVSARKRTLAELSGKETESGRRLRF